MQTDRYRWQILKQILKTYFKSTTCSRNIQKSNLLSIQLVSELLCHLQGDLSTKFKNYARRQQLQNTGVLISP